MAGKFDTLIILTDPQGHREVYNKADIVTVSPGPWKASEDSMIGGAHVELGDGSLIDVREPPRLIAQSLGLCPLGECAVNPDVVRSIEIGSGGESRMSPIGVSSERDPAPRAHFLIRNPDGKSLDQVVRTLNDFAKDPPRPHSQKAWKSLDNRVMDPEAYAALEKKLFESIEECDEDEPLSTPEELPAPTVFDAPDSDLREMFSDGGSGLDNASGGADEDDLEELDATDFVDEPESTPAPVR